MISNIVLYLVKKSNV